MTKKVSRIFCVGLVGFFVLCFFTELLTPTWPSWNNDNTVKGIYKEPENHLQVLFLGTSRVITGISPIELYDRYGICSYNLATEQQPLIASYYWLKEVHRLHKESLNTVVLDVSFLLKKDSVSEKSKVFAEKALTHMKLSNVKIEALKACEDLYDDFKAIDYLVPLRRYHSRWYTVTDYDFDGLLNKNNSFYTRGQSITYTLSLDSIKESTRNVPNYSLTDSLDYSPEEYETEWDEANRKILDEIVNFCDANALNLVLIRLPKTTDDLQHDAINYLAEQYNVPFIDFNDPVLQKQVNLSFSYDFMDNSHPNVFGAEKITDYVGKYIVDHYSLSDIRNNEEYKYLREQREQFKVVEENMELLRCTTLEEYLKVIDRDRYTVFVSVRDEASEGLSEGMRAALADYGFVQFSEIDYREGYVGIRDRGRILVDEVSIDPGYEVFADGKCDADGHFFLNGVYQACSQNGEKIEEPEGFLSSGISAFSVKSGGLYGGCISSIRIGNTEYSDNKLGINFVVYDNKLEMVIDQSTFDTHSGAASRSDLSLSREYLVRTDAAVLDASFSVGELIKRALDKDYSVLVVGTSTDSANGLSEIDYKMLAESGFEGSELLTAQPYLAIFENGRLSTEMTASPDESLIMPNKHPGFFTFWIRKDPGESARMAIGDSTYSVDENQIFVLVYDRETNETVAAKWFAFNSD